MKKYKPLFKEPSCDYLSALLEKTFDIDKDVDYLYKKSNFNSIINYLKNPVSYPLESSLKDKLLKNKDITLYETDSSFLKNEDSQKAHDINPIKIYLGIYNDGSYYNEKLQVIYVSMNYSAINIFIQYGQFGKKAIQNALSSESSYNSIINEIKSLKIKSSISHELSHWISDSLHNRHIKKIIDLAIKLEKPEILLLKQKDVNMTYFEIDAQIHGIKNLKRIKNEIWDALTLTDIFFMYTSLRATLRQIYTKYGKDVLNMWLKNLIKRMSREDLLGTNMKQFPDIKKLTENIYTI
jgi:hypothetical protein